MGKCLNLLHTWKVYFRLVWKSLARLYSVCNHFHHVGKILPADLPVLENGARGSLLGKHPQPSWWG